MVYDAIHKDTKEYNRYMMINKLVLVDIHEAMDILATSLTYAVMYVGA